MPHPYADATQFESFGLPPAALDGFAGNVLDHLNLASGKVDSYLRGRYKVPLPGPSYPGEIVEAVCAIAAFTILSARGFDPSSGADQTVRERYLDQVGRPGLKGWLQQLAEGRVNLDIGSDGTPGVNDGAPLVISRATSTRSGSGGDFCDDCRGGRYNFWGNGCR